MYLVRSIQEHESTTWVDQLGRDPAVVLPLPYVPRRSFDKVVVIHGRRALGFEFARVEKVDEDAVVGSRGSLIIKAKAYIHVKKNTRRVGKARISGFQGIRYVFRWSDIAR